MSAVTGPARAAGEPLISVVLAVHAVEAYLPGCLDSILGQPDPPAGIEVIAVDDASPDACGAILDARAAADPRLRVVHLPERSGPWAGPMRGLAEATGENVWFADPDDVLTGEAWPRSLSGWSGTGPTCCSFTTGSCGQAAAASRAPAPGCWPGPLA